MKGLSSRKLTFLSSITSIEFDSFRQVKWKLVTLEKSFTSNRSGSIFVPEDTLTCTKLQITDRNKLLTNRHNWVY